MNKQATVDAEKKVALKMDDWHFEDRRRSE